jgi:hypothetical protein
MPRFAYGYISRSRYRADAHGCRQKRLLQPDSLPKLFADLPADEWVEKHVKY